MNTNIGKLSFMSCSIYVYNIDCKNATQPGNQIITSGCNICELHATGNQPASYSHNEP
jgi:hypothetical protein